jgi:N-acetylglucosaminyl-diphospho-decaprenol L-rhamnosyltransferase
VTLSIVIVHYRTPEALARLIASLREANPSGVREILVVNHSDEPLEPILAGSPWPARLLTPGTNGGYARGVNAGIRAADASDDVLVLNPDIRVEPGSIETLRRVADAHPKAGILAPKLLNPDGTLQLSARRFYNWKTLILRRIPLGPLVTKSRTLRDHVMADWDHADTRAVDWVLGAAMLVRRPAMRDVGLMDERYFLYFEDVDWCQRMGRHGYEVLYVPEARMHHDYARQSAQLRPRSLRAHAAGLLRFTEKWSALVYAMTQNRARVLQALTFGVDVIAAVLACLAAYGIRAGLDQWFDKPFYPLANYSGLFFFTVAVTLAALAMNGLYRKVTFQDGIDRAFRLGRAVLQSVLLLMATTFLFQTPRYSRLLVLLTAPLLFLAILAGRALMDALTASARRQGFAFRRVLLLGSGPEMEAARAALEGARAEGFEPLHAATPADGSEPPEAAAARLRALIESERIQIVCIVPDPRELPYLLALASALRDSGAAVYWGGSLSRLVPGSGPRGLGPLDAPLLHAPSRGLSLRARKRASDVFLSLAIVPWRWRGLHGHLVRRAPGLSPGDAWRQVWTGERSWVGRTDYERDRWAGVPPWARLALEPIRPGVVSPADETERAPGDRASAPTARVESELAYLARFSVAEDVRIFLRATREGA